MKNDASIGTTSAIVCGAVKFWEEGSPQLHCYSIPEALGVVILIGLRKPLADTAEEEKNRPRTFLVRGRIWRLDSSTVRSGTTRYETVFGKVFRLSMAVGALVVLLAGLFGRIVLLVEQAKDRSVFAVVNGKLSFIMSFERHDEFWIKSYFGKVFHVLSVGEGIAATAVLLLGTWLAVSWLRVKQRERTP